MMKIKLQFKLIIQKSYIALPLASAFSELEW